MYYFPVLELLYFALSFSLSLYLCETIQTYNERFITAARRSKTKCNEDLIDFLNFEQNKVQIFSFEYVGVFPDRSFFITVLVDLFDLSCRGGERAKVRRQGAEKSRSCFGCRLFINANQLPLY